MSMVHLSRGSLDPPSADLRSEVDIVCGLARALGDDSGVDWSELAADYDLIRDRIEAVVPGFEHFNERVRQPGGFELPHPANDRTFTGDGIAHLTVNPFRPSRCRPDACCSRPSGRTTSTTRRSTDSTIATAASTRAVTSCSCNPTTWPTLGFADGDDRRRRQRARRRRATGRWRSGSVSYPTAIGTCAAYFPEANVLVPLDSVADGSNTPTSKSIIIRFEPRPA